MPSRLILFACTITALAAAEMAPVATRVEAVTVYLDRAYVSRGAGLDLPLGPTRVVLDGFPDELEEASIRVQLPDGLRLESMAVQRVLAGDTRPEERKKLEEERSELEARKSGLLDRHRLLSERQQVLQKLFDNHLAAVQKKDTVLPGLKDYAELEDFLSQRRGTLADELRAVGTELASVTVGISERQQLLASTGSQETDYRRQIVLQLASTSAGQHAVHLSYLVPGALWYPSYDVRADPDRGGMELVYAAFVQNATGEDWRDAQISLAAAKPMQAVVPPKITEWRADLPPIHELQLHNQSIAKSSVDLEQSPHHQSGTVNRFSSTLWNGNAYNPSDNLCYQLEQRNAGKNKSAHQNLLHNAVAVAVIARDIDTRRLSVIFPAGQRASVPSDGKPQRLLLDSRRLPLATSRYAVPSQSSDTYFSGRFQNTFELPLLAGRAQIFIGPDLIAGSDLPFVAGGEHAEIYLGVDEQIRVHRILDRTQSQHEVGRTWSNLDAVFRYEVESFRSDTVAVRIDEALPSSQADEVRVRVRKLSAGLSPDPQGLLRWNVDVTTGRHSVGEVRYLLEWKTGRSVQGLDDILAML